MQTLYDSVTATDIPANATMVAGYVDGRYAWSQADWDRFMNATVKLRITVLGQTLDADVIDVETGDATPADAADWMHRRQTAGITATPIVYCGAWDIENIANACQGFTYVIWAAHYTGQPHIVDGSAATQYADPATSGGHFDLSLCADGFPPTLEPATDPTEPLINALAYVCDSLGDRLDKVRDAPLSRADNEIADIAKEMQRVREQFIGVRAS